MYLQNESPFGGIFSKGPENTSVKLKEYVMWTSEWIGHPYRELGRGPEYDCLGLFLAVQKARHGRILLDPGCSPAEAIRRGLVDQHRPVWARVEQAVEGDALMFGIRGRALHVGYALNDHLMLHIENVAGSRIEDFTMQNWRNRIEGIYRYAG